MRIAQAATTWVVQDGQRVAVERRTVQEPGFVAQHLTVDVRQGEPVTVEKLVALYTSKDRAIAEAGGAARGRVERLADGFDRLLERHVLAWDQPGAAATSTWAATATRRSPAPSTCTCSTCSRRCPSTPSTWMGRAGAGAARGGLPGPHLLGRALHLPVPEPPVP